MKLNKISLINFRNIKKLNLVVDNNLTILYGENGQGKTNIVEAIYLLANANSFRTSYYKEMIANDANDAIVSGEIISNQRTKNYKIILRKDGKQAFINDNIVTKFSEYILECSVVCFAPSDVMLFSDSPSIRRNFLDKELTSLYPLYIKHLISFKNVLEQRNDLLKKPKLDEKLLEVLDAKLIELSFHISNKRKWLINKVEEYASVIYQKLTNYQNQKIKIVYKTFLEEEDINIYFEKAIKIYANNLEKDKEKMWTNVGIHKDDFKVYLNNLEIDMYASQGQQRLMSLSMKLAVAELIKNVNNEEPIIILDDAFSELDDQKKESLLNYIYDKQQVFITCTNYKNINKNVTNKLITLLHIQNGGVLERSTLQDGRK